MICVGGGDWGDVAVDRGGFGRDWEAERDCLQSERKE